MTHTAPNLMRDLDKQAADLAGAQTLLDEAVAQCESARAEVLRMCAPEIRRLATIVARRQSALLEKVAENRAAFEQPKTATLHGFRLGWRKQPGRIECEDDASVIERIRRLLKPLADGLIRVKESLDKPALRSLSGDQLAKIGVSIQADFDAPFVARVAGDTEKLVTALLAEAERAEGRAK